MLSHFLLNNNNNSNSNNSNNKLRNNKLIIIMRRRIAEKVSSSSIARTSSLIRRESLLCCVHIKTTTDNFFNDSNSNSNNIRIGHQRRSSFNYTTSSSHSLSMFDQLKGFFGQTKTMELPPAEFTLKEFVTMSEKAEQEGMDLNTMNTGLTKIGLTVSQLKKIASVINEEEMRDPTKIGISMKRTREVASMCDDEQITFEKVKKVILAYATTAMMFKNIRKAVLERGKSLPKSIADFEAIIKESVASGDMKKDASALRGAYSANQACPCNSGKRFKRCCGV